MKSILLITLLALTYTADPEQCLKEKCPNEYAACQKEVFGCASAAMKCKNQCGGDDAQCMLDCALASKNAKLIALAECGHANCSEVAFTYCDIQICVESFKQECMTSQSLQSFQCASTFLQRHSECQCIMEF
ncbi:unnamed protein product [Paramecium sonneborni]|uniref:Uncharacterized protein n=1 Tax=Paramecium sonneborni TaxID=65129 RepID=A0A8S1KY68_9CILI|nr:unnamed protein product [Paramecium sonneborni]